ncbi:MAG: hypothetical protein SXA11_25895, partial [Cyanobacteriota bacterium]|nr:hypothetical protein [Cyanobacteriota bacterium]
MLKTRGFYVHKLCPVFIFARGLIALAITTSEPTGGVGWVEVRSTFPRVCHYIASPLCFVLSFITNLGWGVDDI